MKGKIRIWGRRSAFNVQKVLWMLDELGLEAEHINVGGAAGGLRTAEFLAMNPNGTIPVLGDGRRIIWESHAILRYLAAEYGAGSLWPPGPGERSEADRWMDWAQTGLQIAFMDLFWGSYRTPEADRDEALIERAVLSCDHYFSVLDQHLQTRDFLAGKAFTMGDIPAATTLFRYFEMDIPRKPLPNVEAWYARLQQRPAFRTHIMFPFDDLYARLDF